MAPVQNNDNVKVWVASSSNPRWYTVFLENIRYQNLGTEIVIAILHHSDFLIIVDVKRSNTQLSIICLSQLEYFNVVEWHAY